MALWNRTTRPDHAADAMAYGAMVDRGIAGAQFKPDPAVQAKIKAATDQMQREMQAMMDNQLMIAEPQPGGGYAKKPALSLANSSGRVVCSFMGHIVQHEQQLIHLAHHHGFSDPDTLALLKEYQLKKRQMSPNNGPISGVGQGPTRTAPSTPVLHPRIWKNDPMKTYDEMQNSLSPVGAIALRMNLQAGFALPHIEHISAHIVQKRGTVDGVPHPATAAFVFIVDDEGTDITLTEEHPHLFPSDNLILRIKMITDK